MSDAEREVAMFTNAGKTREVSLDTLLSMIPAPITKRIADQIKKDALMVSIGMTTLSVSDEIMYRVASYMGWLDAPKGS